MKNTSDFCILLFVSLYEKILSQPIHTQWYEIIDVIMFPFTFL